MLILFLLSFAFARAETSFHFRLLAEPETLDWNRAHTPMETHLLVNLMEGLVSIDSPDGVLRPSPALAKSWKISADGKTYTFYLREGVKWSDGVPLRAEDFIASWKRLLAPQTAALYAYVLFDIDGAEAFNQGKIRDFSKVGVTALDSQTLQVKLIRPVAYWIYIPSFWVTFPIREDLVRKHGGAWTEPGKMVTLGGYTLAGYELGSKVILKANPTYFGTRGNIDQAVGWIIRDDSTALNLYESAKLDFLTDISSLDLMRLSGRADLKSFPYLKLAYLGFVVDAGISSDLKFRRAIAMAIDKSRIGEILHGGQTGASSLVPPPLQGFQTDLGLPFDPEQAKKELMQSQWKPGQALDLLVINSDKPMILAQYIQGQLKKNLGLTVNLQTFDNKTFRAKVNGKAYPAFMSSWSADYPDADTFMSLFQGDSGNNHTSWKNKIYSDGIIRARQMSGFKERTGLYIQLQKILLQDNAVIIPLYYEPNRALVHPWVKNIELDPMNYLNLKKVQIEKKH